MTSKKIKCISCDKKFSMLMIQLHTCRCGSICCAEHMHNHGCVIDYVKLNRAQQESISVSAVPSKINKL